MIESIFDLSFCQYGCYYALRPHFGLLLAPVSWMPCWVWIAPVLIALSSWLQATWRDAAWERWAVAGAVTAIIAVFASTYSVPISEQRHRTIDSFLFLSSAIPAYLLRWRSRWP